MGCTRRRSILARGRSRLRPLGWALSQLEKNNLFWFAVSVVCTPATCTFRSGCCWEEPLGLSDVGRRPSPQSTPHAASAQGFVIILPSPPHKTPASLCPRLCCPMKPPAPLPFIPRRGIRPRPSPIIVPWGLNLTTTRRPSASTLR